VHNQPIWAIPLFTDRRRSIDSQSVDEHSALPLWARIPEVDERLAQTAQAFARVMRELEDRHWHLRNWAEEAGYFIGRDVHRSGSTAPPAGRRVMKPVARREFEGVFLRGAHTIAP